MTSAQFPERRPDGSFTVASRFAVVDAARRNQLATEVALAMRTLVQRGVDVERELDGAPWLDEAEPGTVDLVFEVKSGSMLWKDCMVAVTKDIDRLANGIQFQRFYSRTDLRKP